MRAHPIKGGAEVDLDSVRFRRVAEKLAAIGEWTLKAV
jgi:hypothetical protein